MVVQSFPLDQAVGLLSLAALAAQVWDWIVALSDEVNHLWSGRFTLIKALYLGSRYGLLILQLIDKYLYFEFQGDPLQPLLCTRIFVYKTIMAQTAMTLIEMILLIRVLALYNNSWKARYFFLLVFITSTGLECTAIKMIIDTLLSLPGCIAPVMDKMVERLYGLGAGFCQSVVFIASITRILSGKRTPLSSLMLKEGVVSFILIFVLLIVVIAYEIIRNIDTSAGSSTAGTMGNAIVSWYLAILSVAGSRLILNMRAIVDKHRQRHESYDDDEYYNDGYESVTLRTPLTNETGWA